ncbi:hypothetical protein SRABI96_05276 [Peribacillus sp. Bi96]|nr:hypothetical protein SRABI96_05276 [Peribacillus sp. Bi96]
MSFWPLLVNSQLLLVNLCVTREFAAFTREFAVFTREFAAFTREFEVLLVNSFHFFWRNSVTLYLYIVFFMFLFGLKKQKKDRIPFHKRNPVFFNYLLFCSAVTFCNFIPVYNIPERIDVFRTTVLVV